MSMFRCSAEQTAKSIAREEKKLYGWSVLAPGGWYVGTKEELERIGVEPLSPEPKEE